MVDFLSVWVFIIFMHIFFEIRNSGENVIFLVLNYIVLILSFSSYMKHKELILKFRSEEQETQFNILRVFTDKLKVE